jgi:outer membrane protein assembly factor BamA
VNSRLTLGLGLFVENAQVIAGSALGGTVASDYNRYGASLSTGFLVTEHLQLGLGYQFVTKLADRPSESYTQNRVTISLGYRF